MPFVRCKHVNRNIVSGGGVVQKENQVRLHLIHDHVIVEGSKQLLRSKLCLWHNAMQANWKVVGSGKSAFFNFPSPCSLVVIF